ncbi:hypothetical protein CVT26_005782 [Gymnopilus dilepis]|uniref:Uncharacterized protein n=1 Tax=Gymnopilus dilepis TaxID=231916 RepID=A0A409VPG5_9AGAR|nr:hypothetical protein CVT26_005782 [Gymnopilus dilepis]
MRHFADVSSIHKHGSVSFDALSALALKNPEQGFLVSLSAPTDDLGTDEAIEYRHVDLER